MLVKAWGQHVQKLVDDQRKEICEPDVWGIHDYIAALYIRDRLSIECARQQSAVPEADRSLLETVDRAFEAFTEPDHERLLIRLEPIVYDNSRWWWGRIPKMGPARQELLDLPG